MILIELDTGTEELFKSPEELAAASSPGRHRPEVADLPPRLGTLAAYYRAPGIQKGCSRAGQPATAAP